MQPKDNWFRDLVETLDEGVYFVDRDRLITFWSAGAERITGYSRDDVVGHHCFTNILRHVDDGGRQLCQDGCPLAATILDGKPRKTDVHLHHSDGHRVPVEVRALPIRDGHGRILGAMEVFSDRTEELAAVNRIQRLERDALVDELTEVANRRYTEIAISGRLSELERYGWSFGLLFIDIDGFKEVNDRHGHVVGDQVLRVVARTLSSGLRSHDLVGRWGGEEFVVLLTKAESREDLSVAAERLRVLVRRSDARTTGNGRLRVTVSVGATIAAAGESLEDLIARADELMFESKRAGRDKVTIG